MLLVESVSEIQRRRHSDVVPCGDGVEPLIVIFHPLSLRLHVDTHIHIDVVSDESELYVDVVDIVGVVGISAEVVIEIVVVIPWQVSRPRVADVGDEFVHSSHVVCFSVAVSVGVVESI